ncbi:hypothetical protein HCX48_04180 [Rhodocyclus tenuis]|uniref:YqjK-like family protein n=2 Tax=Rhodocyclus TaxID=1064 RepID=A0A6L5JYC9_RHOTE|nr:YqjK family protein [Rhodocyclus gracilis]MQY51842.1 hypothetical protein [Rhodocyclus gracilis]MRD73469.1 hypothetical protein [Rhodocyclus gracilis]NJA88421.1 hypothetical protein [Rhodocyclus gracilis]
MSDLIDIGVRRGRLLERIARQRADLGAQLAPVRDGLRTTDRALTWVRLIADGVRRHPAVVAAAVAVFVVLKPVRLWRWGRRALFAWRAWRALRSRLDSLVAGVR